MITPGLLEPTYCPFCGQENIGLAIESEIANSYRCYDCRLWLSVTYAPEPRRTWMSTSTQGTADVGWIPPDTTTAP